MDLIVVAFNCCFNQISFTLTADLLYLDYTHCKVALMH